VAEILSAVLVLPPLVLLVRHHWAMPWSGPDSTPLAIAGTALTIVSGAMFSVVTAGDNAPLAWIAGQALIAGIVVWLDRHPDLAVASLDAAGERIESWGARRSATVRIVAVALGVAVVAGAGVLYVAMS